MIALWSLRTKEGIHALPFRVVDAEAQMHPRLSQGLISTSARELTSHNQLQPERWNLKLAAVR